MDTNFLGRITTVASMLLLLSACATTKMTSQVNPQFVGQPVSTVMVVADFSDLQYKQAAESRICEKISIGTTTRCVESGQVFFPGQKYSDEEWLDLLVRNEVDAILVLSTTDAGTNTTYVPPTTSTTTTRGYVSGNTYSGTSTTQYNGGQTYVKPWATFESRLIAVPSGDSIWFASSTTGGNAYANANTLVNSVSSKTYDRLVEDGILEERQGN